MYIRNKEMVKGKYKKKFYIIEDRIKIEDKYKTKNVRYIGTANKLLEDLKLLDKYKEKFGDDCFKNP